MQTFQPPLALALASALLASALVTISAPARSESLGSTSVGQPTKWTISYQGRPVLVYRADPQQYKPYIEQLCTPNGFGVLRNSPADHLHHHALMYGIKVNDLNFWEEAPGAGVQKVVETTGPETFNSSTGLPGSRLVQLIYWVPAEDAFLPNTNTAPLLIERRTLQLVINPKARETALHWKSQFQVGTKTNSVTLSGANYHGLGLRFRQELDPVAVHLNSAGTLDLSGNRQDISPHSWEAVAFHSPENPATIAVFGAPSNQGGNPVFFAMKTPFAYLSATQGLDKQTLTYKSGDAFELNFLITLYPEIKSPEALETTARQWSRSFQTSAK